MFSVNPVALDCFSALDEELALLLTLCENENSYFYVRTVIMPTPKHTIVYAEDDLDDLFILRQAFQRHDHIDVVHAPDGKMAVLILENMANANILPCLVILDINMPVMNGREALQAIRGHEKLSKLPVVLFTTSNNPADRQFAENNEAIMITKPAEFADLEKIVEKFIDRCNFEVNKFTEKNSYRNS